MIPIVLRTCVHFFYFPLQEMDMEPSQEERRKLSMEEVVYQNKYLYISKVLAMVFSDLVLFSALCMPDTQKPANLCISR